MYRIQSKHGYSFFLLSFQTALIFSFPTGCIIIIIHHCQERRHALRPLYIMKISSSHGRLPSLSLSLIVYLLSFIHTFFILMWSLSVVWLCSRASDLLILLLQENFEIILAVCVHSTGSNQSVYDVLFSSPLSLVHLSDFSTTFDDVELCGSTRRTTKDECVWFD